jgi:anti-sigma factor RsiW
VECVDVTEELLAEDSVRDPELDRHVAGCPRCAQLGRRLKQLDAVLVSTLLVAPPLDLQRRIVQLAFGAAEPKPLPWWQRLGELNLTAWLAQRPQTIAAQGLAALMVALASWQVFGWLTSFQPQIGDVAYAVQLVISSPATAYVGSLQIDVQSLTLWSLVGIAGWLISEDGLLGRRIGSFRLRLP